MKNELSAIVNHAKSVVGCTVERIEIPSMDKNAIHDEFILKRACFVSIHTSDGALRGCIGTIEPVEDNLYEEIIRNAQAACTRDSRFDPVTSEELPYLNYSVDVLSVPERIYDIESLDPVKYGIIISDNHYSKAVLLPNLPSVKTVQEQIDIVKRKAGINNIGIEGLNIYRFTTKKYH